MAKESHFNMRYRDYRQRIREVNAAKEILSCGRDNLSYEIKRKMVDHIKHKMAIIALIEDELKMDFAWKETVRKASKSHDSAGQKGEDQD